MSLKGKRLYGLLLAIVFYIFVSDFGAEILSEFMSKNPGVLTVALLAGLPAVISLFLLKDNFKSDFMTIRKRKRQLWLIPIYFVLTTITALVLGNIFTASSTNQSGLEKVTQLEPYNMIAMVLVMIVFGPIMEEIIMQYFIQRLLKKGLLNLKVKPVWASIIAIIIATIVFMLFHMDNLKDITDLSILSYGDLIFFGIIYERSHENLTYAIILHGLMNVLAFLSLIF
ncbi:hypothetical protein IV57_GL001559 [Companilactobacillus kimchiensis]|uniref:CAAX prenyl protease 2/Lysostaphin resistance protein A-like domain-containing protein n=1 Tax=Companilactobacillus kimchiensis TaxID=993692 RepID=A0A0R2L7W9_9LACO|nr:hypothetical protein IV57_GL001559 [Companilactobacillus kimchiensis]